jgi:hypothetical protein
MLRTCQPDRFNSWNDDFDLNICLLFIEKRSKTMHSGKTMWRPKLLKILDWLLHRQTTVTYCFVL